MAKKDTGDVSVWKKLLSALKRREPYVRVGILSSEQHSEGMTVLEIAIIHEFGAPGAGIPQRSFIRGTVELKRDEIDAMIVKLSRRLLTEGSIKRGETPADMLNILGAWLASEIKKYIADGIDPPLKPATIEAKGSSTPLIDTGRLLNAITWEVVR